MAFAAFLLEAVSFFCAARLARSRVERLYVDFGAFGSFLGRPRFFGASSDILIDEEVHSESRIPLIVSVVLFGTVPRISVKTDKPVLYEWRVQNDFSTLVWVIVKELSATIHVRL